jgi:hypothetical protein
VPRTRVHAPGPLVGVERDESPGLVEAICHGAQKRPSLHYLLQLEQKENFEIVNHYDSN